ncbi:Molybdopterin-guanine dinucleotide biosynthesis protein A-like protein [Metallosphaera sedula]|uniref:Molybdopterin-guanine dinucleotide biosynthesis protein A-like protein n=3 Tax=Metallosphaera TaxID=41980 RepID=A4YIB2_METS5|nr:MULTISPECIES: NTP transferase domain-containing protein [Metallosphaera]ABP96164.1 Molybdopterin-guanine dinucleotide biosynthesis protein A-like protein [Metallosphaera sedula DSM 5348]AIM28147.1 Molybdopterin-guanine dinucleotide biosynthesis protein A-like protein [Metallosphaera sedula]AKV74970.1 molybdopterin-guanine dinucleotide biosynthesis protein MobA [Metallosphaera sedula]AKV77208.1 molybdopterin-guanine dinucleotide biosynthesis protein MobA [Metallosphaera sedula]AKV79458.1 mol
MYRDSFDAVILAGGNSIRFGTDKCEFEIDGKSMLKRVAELFELPIIVTDKPRDIKGKIVQDNWKDGPLKALKLALKLVSKEKVFVTGCDFPFLSRGLVEILCSKQEHVATTLTCGKIQPLLSCYSLDYLKTHIDNFKSMTDLLINSPSVYIAGLREITMIDPHLRTLLNVNRVSDLWKTQRGFWNTRIWNNTTRLFVL